MKNITLFFFIAFNLSFAQTDWQKLADNLQFPEGPAWNGKELFVSSCYGGFIAKISGQEVSTFIDSTQKPFKLKQTNGLTFYMDGNLFACDYGIGAILKISPGGNTEIYASGYEGKKFNRPNDLAFDANGNLYFTDPKSYGKDKPDGRLFRIDNESKAVKLIADSLCFPNGIAFSANGKNLYVCESAQNRILKFDVDENGIPDNRTTFVELQGGDPDGIAFNENGELYAAHFGTGSIYVISPDGSVKDTIKAPGKKPSNVEFGDNDYRTLFITEDETNSVYKMRVEIPGIKLHSSPGSKK